MNWNLQVEAVATAVKCSLVDDVVGQINGVKNVLEVSQKIDYFRLIHFYLVGST